MTALLAALTVAICGAALPPATAPAAPEPARERVLVVPFENVTRDGRSHWLTEAAAMLVTSDLDALGVATIGRDDRLKAFERLQLPPAASLSEATIIRLGQLIGAAQIVLGRFTVENGQLKVEARSIRLDSGRTRPAVVESGPIEDLFGVFERVSRGLLPPGMEQPARLDVHAGSLPVFENYIKGLVAETSAARVRFLEAALAAVPDYAPARIALWQVHAAQGNHIAAEAAVAAVPSSSPLYGRARFLVALSRIRRERYAEAYQVLQALVGEPPSAAVLNNIGVVQSRRGGTPQTGRATYYFHKAAEAEPDDPDYAFNLGYAYWEEHDPSAAVYWLREAVRRNPADGDAHFVLGAALQATGAAAAAEREKELARQLSSVYVEWEKRPRAAVDPVPKGLERLRDDLDAPRLTLVDTTLAPSEQEDQREAAAFHLERGRRLYEQRQDGEAVGELKRSLYVLPYQADAHLLLGRIYLRTGRLREATDALRISIWSQETAAAHAVLGEAFRVAGNLVGARAELEKALALDPRSADAKDLGAKLAARRP